MSFIELDGIQDTHEAVIAPEGRYDLLVESAAVKHNDNTGKDNVLVVLSVEGDEEYANVLFNLSLPQEGDEDTSRNFKLLQIKRFCHQFQIGLDDGLNTEEFSGSRASANLKVGEYNNQKKNELVLDALPEGA